MRHDNFMMYVTFMWNWSRFDLCDVTLFIVSCINGAFINNIGWPTLEEKVALGI
jgi:hypothetical protein